MTMQAEATYENGVLKLDQPLPLKENERVHVTVLVRSNPAAHGYGLMGWTGDPDVLRQIAMDPEFGMEECP